MRTEIWSSNTVPTESSWPVPDFPECKNTKPYLEKIGVPCPKCGKDIVIKQDEEGQKILRL